MSGYLPKESENSRLNKTVMRAIWSDKVITNALGVRNANEARDWFREHPHVHEEFEVMNRELQILVEDFQQRAKAGLQEIVVRERQEMMDWQRSIIKKE